jgi:hypothetical protein
LSATGRGELLVAGSRFREECQQIFVNPATLLPESGMDDAATLCDTGVNQYALDALGGKT